jgi:antirestriction protein ArdC
MSTANTTKTKTKTRTKSRRRTDGPSAEELLVADLVALMEAHDLPPWRREWSGHHGEHRNLETGQPYRGANPVLLELGGMVHGHTLPLWIGASQAKARSWFPRKGSKAVRIVRPQLNKRELTADDGRALSLPDGSPSIAAWVSYKPVPVFNAGDLVGTDDTAQQQLEDRIREAIGQHLQINPKARLESAEMVLESWPVPTTWGGSRACYSPQLDQIRMPHPEAFTSREAFCATWSHEQTHSTGHTSRLNRPMAGSFGSSAYAREELVAELGAVLICYRLQIGCQLENHAAYLKNWAQLLREHPRTLFKVLSEARQAADLIAPETQLDAGSTDAAPALAA